MSATVVQVADDVVAQMNSHEFSQEFTAVRRYQPRVKLKELSGVVVHVVPQNDSGTRSDRTRFEHEYTVEVGIRKKVSSADETDSDTDEEDELDELVALSQEMIEFWKTRAPLATSIRLREFSYPEMLNEVAINEQHVALVRFTLTFQGWR